MGMLHVMVVSTSQKGAKMNKNLDINVNAKIVVNATDALWILDALSVAKNEYTQQLMKTKNATDSFELSVYIDNQDDLIERLRKEIYTNTEI